MPALFDLLYREYCRARLAEMRKQLLISPKMHEVPQAFCDATEVGTNPADDSETTTQRRTVEPLGLCFTGRVFAPADAERESRRYFSVICELASSLSRPRNVSLRSVSRGVRGVPWNSCAKYEPAFFWKSRPICKIEWPRFGP